MLSRFSALSTFLLLSAGCFAQLILPSQTDPEHPLRPERMVKVGRASAIDTRSFSPQIGPSFGPTEEMPENPLTTDWDVFKLPNRLSAGEILPLDRVEPRSYWPAINATGWVPADPTMAVGPNHVVVTTNATLAFFSKTGTMQFSQDAGVFFSGIKSTTFQFDPRVLYDRIANRWVLIYDEKASSPQTSRILVAVSDDSDPNGVWFRYSVDAKLTVGTATYWLDYPGFGYNNDGYVVSGNMFRFTSGFGGVQFIVLPKAPMLTGAPVTASYFRDANSGTAQMADCLDPSISSLYGVSRLNSTTARVYAISNIGGTPSLNFTNVAIPSAPAPSAAAPSTPGDLDPLDGRIFSATWRSGHLFASHTVGLSGGVNAVRWYDVNLNSYPVGTPTLAQSGNVTPPAGPHYHMGAIAANGYNDVSTIFTRSASSGAGAPADAMAAGRKSSDPAGSMGTPILLSTSQGPSYGGVGDNRWGDYFAAGVDPTDDATFWGVAMVANASGGWITVVNSWTVTPPAVLDSHTVPPTISGGGTGVGTVNLNTPAPQFGYVVSLTSANPGVASVPATVTVPGGATSANYTITTSAVTTSTPVQITASLRGVNKPATTTVVPAGQLSGTVTLGGFTVSPAGRQVTIEIRNVGSTSPLQTAVVTLDGSGHFAMATSLVGAYDVAVKSSHWLRKRVANVTFTAAGASGVNATLTNGDVNGDNTVSLGDFQQLRTAFGSVPASSNWNAEADLNGDGTVSIADFQILRTNFGAIGDN